MLLKGDLKTMSSEGANSDNLGGKNRGLWCFVWFSHLKSLFSARESEGVWCVQLGRCDEDVVNGKGWAEAIRETEL